MNDPHAPSVPPIPSVPEPTKEVEQARNEAQARVADVHVEEGTVGFRRGAELAAS